jgi:hypothetical protein
MRTPYVIATGLLFLLFTVIPARAQQEQGEIGIGMGIGSSFAGELPAALTPTIYVPIALNSRLVLEPEFGYVRFSDTDGEFDETFSLLTLGAGLLFEIGDSGPDRIYAGPRLGIVRVAESDEGPGAPSDDSSTNLWVAGVLGGEFFLRPRFGLGGEVGLEWLELDDSDGSVLATTAEFRVRWYFP